MKVLISNATDFVEKEFSAFGQILSLVSPPLHTYGYVAEQILPMHFKNI